MTKPLGPLTKSLENTALNSLPRFIRILSKASGSNDGVSNPSPKSPLASNGRKLVAELIIHVSGFGRFLEHVLIIVAKIVRNFALILLEIILL